MPDEQIDTSEIPALGPEFWKRAKVVLPESKTVVTLRVDQDVVAWFKKAGKGYQSRMNAVLRSYMEHAQDPSFSAQFDAAIAETRRQAKAAGLKKSDITAAIARARKKG